MSDRLSPLAATIQGKTKTNGSGFKLWETRRRNKFLQAVELLVLGTEKRIGTELLALAADDVSEFLAEHLPEHADTLPRGYQVLKNKLGDRSLARDGKLFSPAFNEPAVDRAAMEQLAHDLTTGWAREIEQFLSLKKAAGA